MGMCVSFEIMEGFTMTEVIEVNSRWGYGWACACGAIKTKDTDATAPTTAMIATIANIVVDFIFLALICVKE